MALGRATASAAPFNVIFSQRSLARRVCCQCASLGFAFQAEHVPTRSNKANSAPQLNDALLTIALHESWECLRQPRRPVLSSQLVSIECFETTRILEPIQVIGKLLHVTLHMRVPPCPNGFHLPLSYRSWTSLTSRQRDAQHSAGC